MPIYTLGGGVSHVFSSRQRFTFRGLSMDDYLIVKAESMSLLDEIIKEIIVFVLFWLFVVLYLLVIT